MFFLGHPTWSELCLLIKVLSSCTAPLVCLAVYTRRTQEACILIIFDTGEPARRGGEGGKEERRKIYAIGSFQLQSSRGMSKKDLVPTFKKTLFCHLTSSSLRQYSKVVASCPPSHDKCVFSAARNLEQSWNRLSSVLQPDFKGTSNLSTRPLEHKFHKPLGLVQALWFAPLALKVVDLCIVCWGALLFSLPQIPLVGLCLPLVNYIQPLLSERFGVT